MNGVTQLVVNGILLINVPLVRKFLFVQSAVSALFLKQNVMGENEDKRSELLIKNMLSNSNDDTAKIRRGVENIPVRKIMEQALYIDNDLLPRLLKTKKETDADVIFWRGVFKSLLWAIVMCERNDYMQRAIAKEKLLREFYQERAELLERELLQYTSIEDIYLSEGYDRLADAIKKRAADLLNKK